MRATILALGSAAMFQCAAFGSSAPDEARDASSPGSEAASPPPDGAPPVDARATTASPCVGSGALICDDFERDDLRGPWESAVEQNDGGLVLRAVPDAGRSLLISGTPDIRSTAYLERFIDAKPDKVTLSYRLRVESLPPTIDGEHFVLLQELFIGPVDGRHGRVFVTLNEIAGLLRVEYGDRNTDAASGYDFIEQSIGAFPLGQWVTVSITVDAIAQTVTATTSFSTGTSSVPLEAEMRSHMVRGPLTARVGATYANAVPEGWSIEVDDYVLAP